MAHRQNRDRPLRIDRLRLNGFKSFTDPTDLAIHEGLTGVVGPNGCGKSNLLEALRWVMGENRASAMRGDGMEDVIFAGTATRGARHFAEVAMVIDNAERTAPSGFNEADTIDVVRRITRDGGSAYRVNGREVRARDVQMLFADASTGAHSPALVRQGQIAELIAARPKARRRILEEAAGISGLYQRRHEAELRLNATEANLARVDDVVAALAAQLAVLSRQARQALRYREIGAELRHAEGMLLWRRWRDADRALLEAEAGLRERLTGAAGAEVAARRATEARTAAETALPRVREEEAISGAVLQRLLVQRDALEERETRARDAVEALRAKIGQLLRDTEREAALNRDAEETVARLVAERATLAEAEQGHDARLDAAAGAAREAAGDLAAREEGMTGLTEDVARLAARHGSVERHLTDARGALGKAEAEAARARTAVAGAREAQSEAAARHAAAGTALAAATARAAGTEAALLAAEAARAETQTREATARAARSEAEGEATALRAEVEALKRLVARETATGTRLLDLVEVEPGFEAALGAALGDDLNLAVIGAGGVSGAANYLGSAGDDPVGAKARGTDAGTRSGWADLPDYATPHVLREGAEPLVRHVTAPPVLARRLAQIGIVAAAEAEAMQPTLLPGQRLVSLDGDLWRWDGFRSGAADAPSAAAARLRQLNRLIRIERDLEEVAATADRARLAHEALQARLKALADADRTAREARRAADAALMDADRALARSEADRSIGSGRRDAAEAAVLRFEAEATAARDALGAAAAAAAALPDLAAARASAEALKTAVDAARTLMMTCRATHDDRRREGEARLRRTGEVGREIAGWTRRLDSAGSRARDLDARRETAETDLAQASGAPERIVAERATLADAIALAEVRRTAATDTLARAETALRDATRAEREAERAASEAREARARSEARVEAATEGRTLATARIAEEAQASPARLLDRLRTDPEAIPGTEALEADTARLKRQREALGAVNLRSEEDARAVQAEHDTLAAEKTDLEAALRTLRSGIAGLNREGRERLLTAFEQVNANFAVLFTHLFGGGEARLVLVESDDPLEAGLEILCQPPGKKLSTLSLLSGGEQTLTAMALIFAVFLANPAPICVLDEVDAPLDDANVTRFCDLMDEMTRRTETRFLVITHHAVTMARMDRLYGVTMGEQGVSQLVSVDLRKAEAMVA